MTNLFGPSNKVVYLKKLVFQSAVRFLILFVLTDAILLKLDLQKRTSVLDNPPNGKLFVYQKCIMYPKIGNVFLIFNIKMPQDSMVKLVKRETFLKKSQKHPGLEASLDKDMYASMDQPQMGLIPNLQYSF